MWSETLFDHITRPVWYQKYLVLILYVMISALENSKMCIWWQLRTTQYAECRKKVKKVKKGIAVCRQACHHRYGNSHAIWDHIVLPATRQRWHPTDIPVCSYSHILSVGDLQQCSSLSPSALIINNRPELGLRLRLDLAPKRLESWLSHHLMTQIDLKFSWL